MKSRDQQLGDYKPASTLIVVPELAKGTVENGNFCCSS